MEPENILEEKLKLLEIPEEDKENLVERLLQERINRGLTKQYHIGQEAQLAVAAAGYIRSKYPIPLNWFVKHFRVKKGLLARLCKKYYQKNPRYGVKDYIEHFAPVLGCKPKLAQEVYEQNRKVLDNCCSAPTGAAAVLYLAGADERDVINAFAVSKKAIERAVKLIHSR